MKVEILIITMMIISINTLGCIDFETSERLFVRIISPHAVIDNKDNIHLVWSGGSVRDGGGKEDIHGIAYKKIDCNGNVIIDTMKVEIPQDAANKFFVDKKCKAHIIAVDSYAIIDNKAHISFPPKYSFENTTYPTSLTEFALDSKNNSHFVFRNDTAYIKHNENGNLSINKSKEEFLGTNSTTLIPMDIKLDSNNNIQTLWLDKKKHLSKEEHIERVDIRIYYIKHDNNGTRIINRILIYNISTTKDNLIYQTLAFITIDTNNDVHIRLDEFHSGKPEQYYMKLDNNGKVLIDKTLMSNVTIVEEHGLVKDANGKNIVVMGIRDVVDSKNNICLFWTDEFHGIYFKKLDPNGNVLIEEKKVVSVNEKAYKNDDSTTSNIYIFIAAVAIMVIIATIYRIKEKKRKSLSKNSKVDVKKNEPKKQK